MFCVTSFLLLLRICIVNAMIFIFKKRKKNIDSFVQDQFLQPVKDHLYEKCWTNFAMFFFFKHY